MVFTKAVEVNRKAVLRAAGYKDVQPDALAAGVMEDAAQGLAKHCTPRWVYRRYTLEGNVLCGPTKLALPGEDIAVHLQGCTGCILLATTLGREADDFLRRAQAQDMTYAFFADLCASTLVEQYADLAEQTIHEQVEKAGEYGTSRYSPGYGDFPLSLQAALLSFLDAGKTIGLTATNTDILLPRKSITAVLGVASHPVQGKLASCAHCALRQKCAAMGNGTTLCGKARQE